MAVAISLSSQGQLNVGTPVPLFLTHLTSVSFPGHQYAVSADGERFLMNVSADDSISPITIVQNWTAALGK